MKHIYQAAAVGILFLAMLIVWPDTDPQPFESVHVADRQCNSCHENSR